jgi:hypothetical protein
MMPGSLVKIVDVSEEHIASIFEVEEEAKQEANINQATSRAHTLSAWLYIHIHRGQSITSKEIASFSSLLAAS